MGGGAKCTKKFLPANLNVYITVMFIFAEKVGGGKLLLLPTFLFNAYAPISVCHNVTVVQCAPVSI